MPKPRSREKRWVSGLFVQLLAVVFAIELAIMLFFYFQPHISSALKVPLDSFFLTVFLCPIIYLLFGRPLLARIGEYEKADAELALSRSRYAAIIRMATDGFWISDMQGKILEANPAYCRMIGYSLQELLKMSIKDVEAIETAEDIRCHIRKIIASGSDHFETRHRRKDGRVIVIEVNVNYFPEAGGRLFAFLRDISQRKLIEEKMGMFSAAISQTADMVVITDRQGLIEFVNPAFSRQTGYSLEEVIGKTPRILKSERQDLGFYQRLWRTILSGEVFQGILLNKKKNGELYYSQKTITPLKDNQGNITHFVSTDKDVTILKRMGEELMRANKELWELDRLKSEFINMSSHELRTPLAITKEGISQLAEGICGEVSASQKRFLDISLRNINRLVRVVDNIFDISEIEFDKAQPRRELIDIAGIAGEVIADFTSSARDKGLEIRADFSPDKIVFAAEKRRVRQVLINLISNAVKFTDKGIVEISLRDKGESVECAVADSGRGIAPENLHRIFEKFQQFDRSFGPGEKGTGLGLALAKAIVELHGGRIWAESKPGEGSKFSFVLPKGNPRDLA